MTIHKEGRTLLGVMLVVLIAINFAVFYFYPEFKIVQYVSIAASSVIFLLVLQFFRSPSVNIEYNDRHVLAPAEGKVVVIEESMEDEYFKEKRIQISIFMSPLNVHVNRSPVAGIVKMFKYHPGKYLVAWHPKSSTENERTTAVVEMKNGIEVLFRQIAGAVARRIKWYVKDNDELKQGEEYGFIKFGSRVDIFLPLGTEIKVGIDQKTKGGKTVIAVLKE